VATQPAERRGPSLMTVFLILTAGGLVTLVFVVVPILGLLKKKALGPIPTGFPVRLEFYVSFIALVIGIAIIFIVGQRRPPGTPLTWGEALIGSTFVFGLMLLAYGIVPNEWLKWGDNQLLWRPDKIAAAVSVKAPFVHFGENAAVEAAAGRGRITVTLQAIRDIVAAGIYILMLGLHVALWVQFQKRGRKPAAEGAVVERTSLFGRPLVKRA
jgi:hypothetical protein